MLNSFTKQRLLVFSILLGIIGIAFAAHIVFAAFLNFATAESISIISPATTLTIATGSAADALQVNATSVAVTLSSSTGGTFTLISPSYDLSVATSSVGGTVTSSCSTQGVVSTMIAQSTGSTVYTITPTGTTCSGSVGLPVVNSFSANPSSITAGQSSLLSWTVTNASTTSLDNGVGNVSNETSTLVSPSQTTTYTLTATNGSGSSTTAQATVTATANSGGLGGGGGGGGGRGGSVGVAASYGAPSPVEPPSATGTLVIASSSVATTTIISGTSSVALEAQLQSLLALLANLEVQAARQGVATPSVIVTPSLFAKTLYLGVSGSDVTRLQEFLAEDPAIYPEDKITGYFGTLTLEAVQRFQKTYGIANVGNPGYGHVGPLTRAKLNGLIEQGTTP